MRLSEEAMSQGAYLTCEDLAVILTSSVSTIKRDIQFLAKAGTLVPLRGRMKDIGRATTHKAKIVELFLENYQFTEIEQISRHSEKSIERYLKDFTQVSILIHKGLSVQEIRQVMGISKKLAQEYSLLYQQALKDPFKSRKLKELLGPAEQNIKKN
jgi:predicted transcriptional regulator